MTVLFIGKRFYTNRDALRDRFGRIYQIPKYWADSGIPTQLWLLDYHSRQTIRETHDDLHIVSTPLRQLSWLGQWVRCASSGRADKRTTIVVASGDCYIGFLGYLIARKLKVRFVFDVYDKYDEFGGYKHIPRFDLFAFLLREADQRLFASRALMQSVSHGKGCDLVVPNGVNLSSFRGGAVEHSRDALGLSRNAMYVGYFGSMDSERGVQDLMAAVKMLRSSGTDVQLLLGGPPHRDFDPDQDGVCYMGNLPFDHIPLALASCDILALPYRRSTYLDMASSCKIAEYLACDRPIVATRTPNFIDNFPEQASELLNFLAEPNCPASLAEAIEKQLAEKVIATFPSYLTWQGIAEKTMEKLALR